MSLHPNEVLLAPVVSEKSYALRVNVCMVQSKPKRRGLYRGRRPGWKKAIVQLRPGDSIEIFEGVHA